MISDEDFETESRRHAYKLEDGSNFRPKQLPAKIVVKIKWEEDESKTDKRTLSGTNQEGVES